MTVQTRRSPSRIDEGWIRCPACRTLFKHHHSCTRPLGEPMRTRPEDFEAQVEEARAQARADALAGEQLALDAAVVAACGSCGGTDAPLGDDGHTCTTCMAEAARALAGLPPRAGPP